MALHPGGSVEIDDRLRKRGSRYDVNDKSSLFRKEREENETKDFRSTKSWNHPIPHPRPRSLMFVILMIIGLRNIDFLLLPTFSDSEIPKLIWFTAKESSIDELPENHKDCVDSWRRLNPDYKILYHNDSQAEAFMCQKNTSKVTDQWKKGHDIFLKPEYCDTYLNLPLPVMKADMWRYSILYVYGGFYADINAENLVPIREWGKTRQKQNSDLNQCSLWAGQENNHHLCQWTLAAKPGSKALESVLDLIVERFAQSKRAADFEKWGFVHEYTGPKVFTEGVELALPIRLRTPFSSLNYWIQTWRMRIATWLSRSDICLAPQSTIRYNPSEGFETSYVHNHFEWHTGWVGMAKKLQRKQKAKNAQLLSMKTNRTG